MISFRKRKRSQVPPRTLAETAGREAEGSGIPKAGRFSAGDGRGHPRHVRSALLHHLPESVARGLLKHYGKPYDPNEPYRREPLAIEAVGRYAGLA